jgi:hypothetical protein
MKLDNAFNKFLENLPESASELSEKDEEKLKELEEHQRKLTSKLRQLIPRSQRLMEKPKLEDVLLNFGENTKLDTATSCKKCRNVLLPPKDTAFEVRIHEDHVCKEESRLETNEEKEEEKKEIPLLNHKLTQAAITEEIRVDNSKMQEREEIEEIEMKTKVFIEEKSQPTTQKFEFVDLSDTINEAGSDEELDFWNPAEIEDNPPLVPNNMDEDSKFHIVNENKRKQEYSEEEPSTKERRIDVPQ